MNPPTVTQRPSSPTTCGHTRPHVVFYDLRSNATRSPRRSSGGTAVATAAGPEVNAQRDDASPTPPATPPTTPPAPGRPRLAPLASVAGLTPRPRPTALEAAPRDDCPLHLLTDPRSLPRRPRPAGVALFGRVVPPPTRGGRAAPGLPVPPCIPPSAAPAPGVFGRGAGAAGAQAGAAAAPQPRAAVQAPRQRPALSRRAARPQAPAGSTSCAGGLPTARAELAPLAFAAPRQCRHGTGQRGPRGPSGAAQGRVEVETPALGLPSEQGKHAGDPATPSARPPLRRASAATARRRRKAASVRCSAYRPALRSDAKPRRAPSAKRGALRAGSGRDGRSVTDAADREESPPGPPWGGPGSGRSLTPNPPASKCNAMPRKATNGRFRTAALHPPSTVTAVAQDGRESIGGGWRGRLRSAFGMR